MIPNLNILRAIWRESNDNPASRPWLATMRRSASGARESFTEYQVSEIAYQPHRYDIFFTPLLFDGKRANDNVVTPGVLFADLDGAPEPTIPPSVYWETSPGNTQAVWYLDGPPLAYQAWADLNRRMTYHTQADKGGWMGSKLLRIPDTVNWKRRSIGRLIWHKPQYRYKIQELQDNIPPLKKAYPGPSNLVSPTRPTPDESVLLLAELWGHIGLRSRSLLNQTVVRDRSLHIVRTINDLKKSGISPSDIYTLIWNRPWNKWYGATGDSDRLWFEITWAHE